jgi:uncharacterized protein
MHHSSNVCSGGSATAHPGALILRKVPITKIEMGTFPQNQFRSWAVERCTPHDVGNRPQGRHPGRYGREGHNGEVSGAELRVRVAQPLQSFLRAARRDAEFRIRYDGTSSIGHVVQSLGIPLPEVGRIRIGGADVAPSHRPQSGDVVELVPVEPPQPLPASGARFVLDVHLGSLARRMRVLGLDTWYAIHADDDGLVRVAEMEDRILLSKDRGLLFRRALRHAAYVRGSTADQQVADVLQRFRPPLAPFTRCPMCNGMLHAVAKSSVADILKPGTARSYQEFAQCSVCGQVYWRGAHSDSLTAFVSAADAGRARGRPA